MIDKESILQQLWAVNHANVLLLAGVFFIALGLLRAFSNTRLERTFYGIGTLAVLALATGCMAISTSHEASPGALFVSDSVTLSGAKLAILGGVFLTLLGWDQIRSGRAADHYGVMLLMLSGLMYAAAANDLTSLFLGLELVSIPTTVLLSMSRNDNWGREATLKYFTLAAFTSAIFLLGASYLYGLSGSTCLPTILEAISHTPTPLVRIALGLALCGLCFRITAVPFQFYAPDVFAGSASYMAASMSFVPKVAGFVGIVRLLGGAQLQSAMAETVVALLLVIAGVTMTLGNCTALVQTRMRRMLAYSSMAHSGYLLIAVAALLSMGSTPTIVFDYLMVYAAMTLGMFALMTSVEQASGGSDELACFNGLHFRSPWLTIGGVICLLSLTGLPLTAGFWAKLQVFLTSVKADRLDIQVVAIVMAINATIAAIYYLSLVHRFYQGNQETRTASRPPLSISIACALSGTLTAVWFFYP